MDQDDDDDEEEEGEEEKRRRKIKRKRKKRQRRQRRKRRGRRKRRRKEAAFAPAPSICLATGRRLSTRVVGAASISPRQTRRNNRFFVSSGVRRAAPLFNSRLSLTLCPLFFANGEYKLD
jgi:hypothetical protein